MKLLISREIGDLDLHIGQSKCYWASARALIYIRSRQILQIRCFSENPHLKTNLDDSNTESRQIGHSTG